MTINDLNSVTEIMAAIALGCDQIDLHPNFI